MHLETKKDREIKLLKHNVIHLIQAWVVAQTALRGGEISQQYQAKLLQLDQEKRKYQTTILEIVAKSGINTCSECKGQCCYLSRKDESRFYALDYWLRVYTPKPIPDQDEIYLKFPLIVLLQQALEKTKKYIGSQYDTKTERIRYLVKSNKSLIPLVKIIRHLKKKQKKESAPIWPPIINGSSILCKYGSVNGCKLDPGDRPITCIVHFCDRIIKDFDKDALNRILVNIRGLVEIHKEVIRGLRNEGRLGFLSGRVRLAIPLYSTSTMYIQHIRRIF